MKKIKACWLIDLDGTLFRHSTNVPLPGAVDFVKDLKELGFQIIFTTRRGNDEWGPNHPVYSEDVTIKVIHRVFDIDLREHNPDYQIVFGLHSPRIVVNDSGADGLNVATNNPTFPDRKSLKIIQGDIPVEQQDEGSSKKTQKKKTKTKGKKD